MSSFGTMAKEYCPDCSLYEVEEYDPVTNWRIPDEFVTTAPVAESIDLDSVKNLLAKIFVKKELSVEPSIQVPTSSDRIIRFIKNYKGDLFNTSAIFILKKIGAPVNLETKRFTHSLLRSYQLKTFNISKQQFAEMTPGSQLIDVARKYDKSIYNLSPVWALKLAKEKENIGNLLLAMRAIDHYT